MSKRLPSVVLVGRPNVGKSTLFNKLTKSRRAIVTAIPGTTRDLISREREWEGKRFELTDTGGMFGASEDPLHALVLARGQRAITTADLLVLLVDGREGLVPGDREIAEAVRAVNRPVVLAVNKTDDHRARAGVVDFYQLGFDPVLPISAEHGDGVAELLEAVASYLRAPGAERQAPDVDEPPEEGPDEAPEDPGNPHVRSPSAESLADISVAIAGRPNAGKSSLVNRLLRDERMIVSEMPGTTRDAVESLLTWHKRSFRIVDTAGIRKAGRVSGGGQVEQVSVLLSRRAIEGSDIVVLVVDASVGVTDQDAAIAGEADKAGRGVVIVANKWDLMKDRGPDFVKLFDEEVRRHLKFLDYAPILHISAATGERTSKLLETIDRVAKATRTRVKTHPLNTMVERITREHPPVSPGNRHVRVLYAAQIGVAPPSFAFFTNIATTFHFSYTRFLENQIREAFGFIGTPIRITVRARRVRTERSEDTPKAKRVVRKKAKGPDPGKRRNAPDGKRPRVKKKPAGKR